jgi:hypothetical protein
MYVRSLPPWFRPEDHAHMLEGLRCNRTNTSRETTPRRSAVSSTPPPPGPTLRERGRRERDSPVKRARPVGRAEEARDVGPSEVRKVHRVPTCDLFNNVRTCGISRWVSTSPCGVAPSPASSRNGVVCCKAVSCVPPTYRIRADCCICSRPLCANSGHSQTEDQCPLLGVKRTSALVLP